MAGRDQSSVRSHLISAAHNFREGAKDRLVRGNNLAIHQNITARIDRFNQTAGLFDDDHTGSKIPDVQAAFPEGLLSLFLNDDLLILLGYSRSSTSMHSSI